MDYQKKHEYYHEIQVKDYDHGVLNLVVPSLKYSAPSLKWLSDPDVRQYMGADFLNLSIETEQKRLEGILNNTDEYHWIIEFNGEPIGNVNINSIEEQTKRYGVKAAYLTILIGERNYWGKGIAFHVNKAILKWVFEEANFQMVIGRALQENIASIKMLEKLGFEKEGTEPYDGLVNGKPSMWKRYKIHRSNYQNEKETY